jgi:hypothetical protein
MDGRRDSHSRQVEEIVIAQHLHFRHQLQAQLRSERLISAIGRFLLCQLPVSTID